MKTGLSPEAQQYARILQHPDVRVRPMPTMREFRSWDREKQGDSLAAFRAINPGTYFEAMEGKRILRIDRIVTKGLYGIPDTRNVIVWGEALDIK